MANVVMRLRANVADAEGQPRLRPFQSLALALFVAAQHQRFVRRLQVEANHVPKLLLKLRIRRDLECPGEMRLQICPLPNRVDGVRRKADSLSHRPHTPPRATGRRLCDPADHLLHFLVRQPRLAAAPRLVPQAIQPILFKTPRPFADRGHARPQLLGNSCFLSPLARSRMIRARRLSRCELVPARVRRPNSDASSGVSSITEMGLAMAQHSTCICYCKLFREQHTSLLS